MDENKLLDGLAKARTLLSDRVNVIDAWEAIKAIDYVLEWAMEVTADA